MGIAGLLPQLRSITKKAHISKYRGQTVAIDAYCLLHRGAYTCSRELVEGEPTDRHVSYCMGRIDLLLGAGVIPLVVFDGGKLPNKDDEERSRHRSREENRGRARALWAAGNRTAAMECYQKSVDILPAHAKQFVEALKRRGIAFVVAPYEADAQMAYMALNGMVDVVLTEDSDLLCYGCPVVFFKMDKMGEGEEVALQDLPQAKELALQGFGHELFQEMCVLAGCDFVSSLPGIGIKKAHQHLRRTRCFLKVVRSLRFDGTKIPEGYERGVQRALWTFKHQRVYCPRRRAAVHLHEVVGGDLAAGARVPAAAQLVGDEPDFLGPPLTADVAHAIAIGDLDPITKLPFADDLQPCTAPLLADAAASGSMPARAGPGSLRQAPSGQQQQQHKGGHGKSGQQRGKSGQQQQQQAGAGKGGTTLMNFGFVRTLAKTAPAADFKPPRPTSAQPGSQESDDAAAGAAAAAAGSSRQQQQQLVAAAAAGSSRQQQQQEQQLAAAAAAGSSRQQHQQQHQQPGPAADESQADEQQEPASPPAARHAAPRDVLASPTDEQWEKFRQRQRRHKPSGRAPLAAVAAAGPASGRSAAPAASSSHFGAGGKPAAAPVAGSGLLARLRAALQPEEPTIDDVLGSRDMEPSSPAGVSGLGEGEWQEEEQAQEEQQWQPGGGRARFVIPTKAQLQQAEAQQQQQQAEAQQQQQQWQQWQRQPKTPLDLGLRCSPTVDEVLAASVSAGHEEEEEEAGGRLPSLACSPLPRPRYSQRLWLPQRTATAAAGEQQQPQLELISPAGPAFLGQQQQPPQITPGFYMSSGSEAGSDARRLTSLQRCLLTGTTPGSSSPRRLQSAGAAPLGASAGATAALQPCFDAAAPGEATAGEQGEPGFLSGEDPIASLRHVAAFQGEAEAAVDRAARSALAATSHAALRPLPPPPHLQGGGGGGGAGSRQPAPPAAAPAGKRALLGEKENGRARLAAGGKRLKRGGDRAGSAAPSGGNVFSGFAL